MSARSLLRRTGVLAPAGVGLLFGVAYFIETFSISGRDAIYPRIISVVLVGVASLCLLADNSAAATASASPSAPSDPLPDPATNQLSSSSSRWDASGRRIGVFLVILFVSVLAIEPIGFFGAGAILLAGTCAVLGVRSLFRIVVYTVAIEVVGYLVFVVGLSIPLPDGPW